MLFSLLHFFSTKDEKMQKYRNELQLHKVCQYPYMQIIV